MTDPIADFLTRIRNANKALVAEVEVNHSMLKERIAMLLKREGYIADYHVEGTNKKTLKVRLKFHGRKGVIEGVKRVSKPGLRQYVGSDSIPRVLGGMGIAILSTPRGVMTGAEARRANVGGEVICYVW